MSLAGDIRKFLAIEEATAREVADHLGVKSRAEVRRVRNAIYDMAKSGMLTAAPGSKPRRWHLRPGLLPPERGEKQEKIWRAVKIEARGFTIHEIVVLAGTAREYTQRYLRFLAAHGYIEAVGRKQVRKYGLATAYRLIAGKEQEAAPRYQRRAEEARKKGKGVAGGDPLAEFRAGMGKFLDGMREVLGVATGYCEQAQEIVEEMAGFLGILAEEGEKAQETGDGSPEGGDQ